MFAGEENFAIENETISENEIAEENFSEVESAENSFTNTFI